MTKTPVNEKPQKYGSSRQIKPKFVALKKLKPTQFYELTPAAFRIFCRLALLTKDGTQQCVYTNFMATHELEIAESTASAAFKALAELGYISVEFRATPLIASKARTITLTDKAMAKLADCSEKKIDSPNKSSQEPLDLSSVNSHRYSFDALPIKNQSTDLGFQSEIQNCSDRKHVGTSTAVTTDLVEGHDYCSENGLNKPVDGGSIGIGIGIVGSNSSSSIFKAFALELPLIPSRCACAFDGPIKDSLLLGSRSKLAYIRTQEHDGFAASGRVGTLKFDFTSALADMGIELEGFAGEQAAPVFDFTELAQRVDSMRDYGHKAVCYLASSNELKKLPDAIPFRWAHEYFRFAVLDEICNYNIFRQRDGFEDPNRIKFMPKKLEDYCRFNQYSLLFSVLSAKWGVDYVTDVEQDWDGREYDIGFCSNPLLERIFQKYVPSNGAVPLRFASAFIAREVLNILKDPELYSKAFDQVITPLSNLWGTSSWLNRSPYSIEYEENLLRTYYPSTDAGDRIMVAVEEAIPYGFAARLSYPFLLLRKIFQVQKMANYGIAPMVQADATARECLRRIGIDLMCEHSWNTFVARHQDAYPFLTKLEFAHV